MVFEIRVPYESPYINVLQRVFMRYGVTCYGIIDLNIGTIICK